ncbi:UTRA domain-containing protein [Actinacidiphila sp. DG2A-62]|uniref:GntR family transcriptional regulator n=1 Tax=Actinacidiphila sp. DG2A-62 TaxID=3108821 RepID=UPI002DBA1896|nr:UTRA domain-containing protein [Actinacidiphila sp. DG2A-62]MEC3997437.1 UTRA domain-containing protein [Actinacidiphila sp. DG2A-62]
MGSGEWVHTSASYVGARAAGEQDAWGAQAAARGRAGTQRIIRAGETAAPAEVAALLGLVAGDAVVERSRLILLDGEPTEVTTTYYPVGIARGTPLERAAKIRGGSVTLLAELGHRARTVREDVRARFSTPAEQQTLGLPGPEPVLELVRVSLDAEGAPFQVDVSAFRAGGQRLHYEMRVH